jgi:hypothetical protein
MHSGQHPFARKSCQSIFAKDDASTFAHLREYLIGKNADTTAREGGANVDGYQEFKRFYLLGGVGRQFRTFVGQLLPTAS